MELLLILCCTASMLVARGVYPSRRVANRRLATLHRRGKIKRVGLVQLKDTGRPEYLYYCRNMKVDNAQHNAELARLLMVFVGWVEVLTGPDVDQTLFPDATLIYSNGQKFHIEWDTGSMTYRQVIEQRWEKYKDTNDIVLWISSTETRRNGFISRAKDHPINRVMLFATYDDALQPFSDIWYTFDGTKKYIPNPIPNPVQTPVQEEQAS